jgi:hypothetical protein
VNGDEVLCFHVNTRPLLLWLDLEPGTRYLMFATAGYRPRDPEAMLGRMNATTGGARFVVADLRAAALDRRQAAALNPADPLALPPDFPADLRSRYPWTEPVVFRSGRYVVFRKTRPIGPSWYPRPGEE